MAVLSSMNIQLPLMLVTCGLAAIKADAPPLFAGNPFQMVKNVKIQKNPPCKLAEPQLSVFNTSTFRMKGGRNKLIMNGYGEVTADMTAPITITFNRTKCNLLSGECEHYNTFTIPDACFLMLTQALSFFNHFRPAITGCPIKRGRYDIDNVEMDLTFFANLPTDGLRYVTQLMMQTNGRVGFCIDVHWTMTNARASG